MRPALICTVLLPGCLLAYDPCDVEDDGNLLGDGDFEALTCWADGNDDEVWPFGGLTDEESSPGSGAPVFLANNPADSDTFAVQLLQGPTRPVTRKAPLDLESGDDYEIRFWAKADPPRTIIVQLTDDNSAWSFEERALTDEWSEVVVQGTIAGGNPEEAYLDLQLGGAPGPVWLDDVVLEVAE